MRRILLGALGALVTGLVDPAVAEPAPAAVPQADRPALPESVPAPAALDSQGLRAGPVAAVRTLQLLQDRVASGSVAAHEGQPRLIARINADLLAAAPEVWADGHHVRAAIVFSLSGGGPAILRRLTALDGLGEREATLARGALAFIEGRDADANRLLRDFDTAGLPPTLAGAVGLAQASLIVTENPVRAIALLDRVRLLLPGTLSEEGALRREVFALGQIGDLHRFEALAIQYLRRFPHSVYAGNFRQRLAYQLTQFDVGRDEARFGALNRIVNELAAGSRRDLYLLIARTAIQEGKTASARLAADKALALCGPESPEAAQGRLYRAAAEIVDLATFEPGLRTLQALDRSKLPARDIPLLKTALATAEEIGRGLVGTRVGPVADTAPSRQAQAAADSTDGAARLIPKAQATIDQIDLLLQKATP
ncbi:MAG: chemotaxis protein [Methylobacterium sp.]|uniref:chemotaxis protein n=1 Tax=Methylobacterium sp. TaxID=409 RepID=UPI000FA930B4|nr:chemotaxis protein [Methylobacterium sp.]RUP12748.1 MAG: chemotaxis protein [Methylobacterium sp.]